jgi:nicotinate-nucleotide adenylyltransferase
MTGDTHDLSRGLKIGLLGGSFNPAHEGHLEVALAVMHRARLDRCWFVVTPGNPLKATDEYLADRVRFGSVQALTRGHPRLTASDIEYRLGTRYSADTVSELQRRWPQTRFVWIMGADSLTGFHLWRDWRRLAALVPMVVVSRPGWTRRALASQAARALAASRLPPDRLASLATQSPPAWVYLRSVHNPASATALREIGMCSSELGK